MKKTSDCKTGIVLVLIPVLLWFSGCSSYRGKIDAGETVTIDYGKEAKGYKLRICDTCRTKEQAMAYEKAIGSTPFSLTCKEFNRVYMPQDINPNIKDCYIGRFGPRDSSDYLLFMRLAQGPGYPRECVRYAFNRNGTFDHTLIKHFFNDHVLNHKGVIPYSYTARPDTSIVWELFEHLKTSMEELSIFEGIPMTSSDSPNDQCFDHKFTYKLSPEYWSMLYDMKSSAPWENYYREVLWSPDQFGSGPGKNPCSATTTLGLSGAIESYIRVFSFSNGVKSAEFDIAPEDLCIYTLISCVN